MDKRAIGVFDSGIGGIVVLKELKKTLPNERFIYVGDTLNFPYGNKSKDEIIKYSQEISKYLINQNVKMIIIACGTATSQSINILKEKFDLPIVGIIEPTVKYIKENNIKKIGIMATEGTVKSGAWETNLKQEIKDIEVISCACPQLAEIVENGKENLKESKEEIKKYVKVFKENNVKDIIMGCTHYPVIQDIIQDEFEEKINLINTGVEISKFVKEYLTKNEMENDNEEKISNILITKEEENFELIAKNILKSSQMLDFTVIN